MNKPHKLTLPLLALSSGLLLSSVALSADDKKADGDEDEEVALAGGKLNEVVAEADADRRRLGWRHAPGRGAGRC